MVSYRSECIGVSLKGDTKISTTVGKMMPPGTNEDFDDLLKCEGRVVSMNK